MLSVAIKNAIIVILVIFIFHFLLKTHLFEKRAYSHTLQKPIIAEQPKCDPVPCLAEPAVPVTKSQEHFEEPEKKDDELFRFVFENSNNDKREGTRIASKCPVSYSPSSGDTTGISSCNTHIIKAPEETNNDAKCDAKAFSIINEYENESIMNGGQLFQGICGFDGADVTPSSIDAFFSPTLV